jgi:hypothetical protein
MKECPLNGPFRKKIVEDHGAIYKWVFHAHYGNVCAMVSKDKGSKETIQIWDGEYRDGGWKHGKLHGEMKQDPLVGMVILRELWEHKTWEKGKVSFGS